ncbi:MAG TPA: hypothetical protein VLA13_09270, partial [Massilibacterium sp.]|nr:hypothetical protein [Massilibacterium sp.]
RPLLLVALMAVNIQVGMNDGSSTDINLLGLEASIFSPAAMANIEEDDCHENGECEGLCGSGYVACTYMDCGAGTQLCHKS